MVRINECGDFHRCDLWMNWKWYWNSKYILSIDLWKSNDLSIRSILLSVNRVNDKLGPHSFKKFHSHFLQNEDWIAFSDIKYKPHLCQFNLLGDCYKFLFFSFFFLVLNYLWYRTNLSFLLYWWESFNSFFIEVWADLYFLCLLQGNRRFIDDCTRSGKEKVSRHQSIHIIVLFSHTWGWFKTNF